MRCEAFSVVRRRRENYFPSSKVQGSSHSIHLFETFLSQQNKKGRREESPQTKFSQSEVNVGRRWETLCWEIRRVVLSDIFSGCWLMKKGSDFVKVIKLNVYARKVEFFSFFLLPWYSFSASIFKIRTTEWAIVELSPSHHTKAFTWFINSFTQQSFIDLKTRVTKILGKCLEIFIFLLSKVCQLKIHKAVICFLWNSTWLEHLEGEKNILREN